MLGCADSRCPTGAEACEIPGFTSGSKAFECVNTASDLESCEPFPQYRWASLTAIRWWMPATNSGPGGGSGLYPTAKCLRCHVSARSVHRCRL